MPVFEYQCLSCLDEFEILVRGSSGSTVCPSCGSEDMKKKFSVFGMKSSSGKFMSSAGSSCGGCNSNNCGGCNR